MLPKCVLSINGYFILYSLTLYTITYYIVTIIHVCLLLQEVRSYSNTTELERFLLDHGEQIVDTLGSEVDRIEMKLKVKYLHTLSCYY